jgi:hypothetical protein
MSQKVIGFAVMAALVAASVGACATGTVGDTRDSGIRNDSGSSKDGSTTPKDSSTPPKDSSTPIQDGTTCSFTICGNLCVDTTQDDSNCGQCNNACPTGATCTSSQCVCTGGMTLCSASCVDTTSDNNNCGTCNHVCASNTTCMSSTCQAQASGTPPQGNCVHDLCTPDIGALTMGCDPKGCVTSVCSNDSYCCDTEWDSICTGEVATYCPPYTCP